MYRAIGPEWEIKCERYELTDNGVELYDEDDEFIAFVPFTNLYGLMNEGVYSPDEGGPSIM